VSFYNETLRDGPRAIPPTPTIGMLGLLEDISCAVPAAFASAGDAIVLLGETFEELGGSEYLALRHGVERGRPPALDLERERRLQELLVTAAARGLLGSAHDVSEGGLAVALAECALRSGLGLEARLPPLSIRLEALLFGESASRAVLSCAQEQLQELLGLAREQGVPALTLGRTGGERIRIEPGVDVTLAEAHDVWSRTLPEALA
jgi:phosphoribosylformylglycinamidine synthase